MRVFYSLVLKRPKSVPKKEAIEMLDGFPVNKDIILFQTLFFVRLIWTAEVFLAYIYARKLVISLDAAQAHSGTIEIRSKIGQGTTFIVALLSLKS